MTWQEVAAGRKERRARNRDHNMRVLRVAGVQFQAIDNGWQLRIERNGERIDFMAGTGAWSIRRDGVVNDGYRGAQSLIRHLTESASQKEGMYES